MSCIIFSAWASQLHVFFVFLEEKELTFLKKSENKIFLNFYIIPPVIYNFFTYT